MSANDEQLLASERLLPMLETVLEGHGVAAKKRRDIALSIIDNLRAELSRDSGDKDFPLLILIVEDGELTIQCTHSEKTVEQFTRSKKKRTDEQIAGDSLFDFASGLVRSQAALITCGGAS